MMEGFPGGSESKASACNVGDLGLIPGLGRPGERKGYPLQYSGLENSVDCIVHEVAKSQTWLSDFHFQDSCSRNSPTRTGSVMNCSTPGLPVHHQLPEFTQSHVHRVGDAIQPSHLLSSLCPPAPNLSQHQGLFQWVSSSHEVAKVLEFQLQHHSFKWTARTNLL